jgi:trehalose 6-phosphate phosphatase
MTLIPPPNIDTDHSALFLDLDGTLAPFASRPELVGPLARRTAAVSRALAALNGRLAVISGRPLEEIDRILEGAAMAAAGVHGLERRSAGGAVGRTDPHPTVALVADVFHGLAEAEPGLLVEDKGLSVALHYRNAPEAADIAKTAAERLAKRTGLRLQRGDCVVELRTPGADKGDAVRAFMHEPPFQGAQPIFVGDDLTDEAGFAAAEDLGGYGVRVGSPERPTAARYALADIEAVLAWLETLTPIHAAWPRKAC